MCVPENPDNVLFIKKINQLNSTIYVDIFNFLADI